MGREKWQQEQSPFEKLQDRIYEIKCWLEETSPFL